MADSICLETKVRNMSGKAAVFGFLPPHGKKLQAGGEYVFFGSATGLLQAITSKRKKEAFVKAVKAGKLVVVSTPAPLFYDEVLDVTKTIKVANNAISTADPCGITYSSSI